MFWLTISGQGTLDQDRYMVDPAKGSGRKSCLTGIHQKGMEIGKGG